MEIIDLSVQRFRRLQDAGQRFVYDLESSSFYGACDETPAHKVWSQLYHDKAGWPMYEWGVDGRQPADILSQRWQLPVAWIDAIDADYEAGRPRTYTPVAWAAFLRMPEALYRALVDLVLDGRSETVWALADGELSILSPSEPDAVAARVDQVLALARPLPLAQQLEVIRQMSASMQTHWQSITEEYAARARPPGDA